MNNIAGQAVAEVLKMLDSVELDLQQESVWLEGRTSSVTILVRAGEGNSFHLLVRCAGPGNLAVDWSGLGIRLGEQKEDGRGDRWFRITGVEGQVDFHGKLSKGARNLRLEMSRHTLTLGQFPRRVARAATSESMALPYFRQSSQDGLVIAEAEMTSGGRIQMIVEGQNPGLANASVYCEMARASGPEPEWFELRMNRTRAGRPCAFHELAIGVPEDTTLRLAVFQQLEAG
jgi:hypothetical protein